LSYPERLLSSEPIASSTYIITGIQLETSVHALVFWPFSIVALVGIVLGRIRKVLNLKLYMFLDGFSFFFLNKFRSWKSGGIMRHFFCFRVLNSVVICISHEVQSMVLNSL